MRASGRLRTLPFFAVSVGTKVQAKDWGLPNWRALLQVLAETYPGYGLVVTGAREEAAVSEAAVQGWRETDGAGPAVNVCGELSPRETAAAFRHAQVFVGHDSGPMHLAGVMGTPTVAVFAARNQPRTWFPVSAQNRVVYHRVDCWGGGLETCRGTTEEVHPVHYGAGGAARGAAVVAGAVRGGRAAARHLDRTAGTRCDGSHACCLNWPG